MNGLGQFLDEREDADGRKRNELDAKKGWSAWMMLAGTLTPEERLLDFDRWVRRELGARLNWTWAGAAREKRIEQCRMRLEQMVLGLWRRGWMLDGRRLASHVTGLLDAVAAQQGKGELKDFWAYFEACTRRYVGANAEELQAEAMSAGAHVGQALSVALRAGCKVPETPLPELIAQRAKETAAAKGETLRGKLARARAREKADRQQGTLL